MSQGSHTTKLPSAADFMTLPCVPMLSFNPRGAVHSGGTLFLCSSKEMEVNTSEGLDPEDS